MSERRRRDRLYLDDDRPPGDFVFDERVADVFMDMIGRSVPGYGAIVGMIELLAQRYLQQGSRGYDLGCSLGAAALAMARAAPGGKADIVGVDNAPAMLNRARNVSSEKGLPVAWVCADIRDVEIKDASIVVMNFTLQFLPIEDRLAQLEKIHAGLRPGGVLILSEKIAAEDSEGDRLLVDLHHDFKRANGYSELEISRKRAALENVLIPETLRMHRDRLVQAGFRRSDIWFQCFNFVSLVAQR